jgi:putative oxidoreductase
MNIALTNSAAINLSLLAMRVMLGAMIFLHGYRKIFGGGRIPGTAAWFESIGVRPGLPNAWAAALTEVGSGLLLILGLLTPLAAAGLASVMIVAIVTVHRKNGFFIFNPGEGYEYCLVVAVLSIALGGLGAGEWSLDHAIKAWNVKPGVALAIAAILGIGGAALQLAACYRPSKVAADS